MTQKRFFRLLGWLALLVALGLALGFGFSDMRPLRGDPLFLTAVTAVALLAFSGVVLLTFSLPSRPDGSQLYGLRIEVVACDRVAAVKHLRKLAADIEDGDATGWTTSDLDGSTVAEPFVPQNRSQKTT